MKVRSERIQRAQRLMRDHDMIGIMVMNHDDFRYFFGADWTQPRAIIPREGAPILISFAGEEPELKRYLGEGYVQVFTHVGEQIQDVFTEFHGLAKMMGPPVGGGKPKVGMQMWFDTPAFLADLFRKANWTVELVPSDPVMDALRAVKEFEEVELIRQAQRVAGRGMDRVREMLRPGVTSHEVATEALYTMMKAGAEKTSTPLYVNFGVESCMLHGRLSPHPLKKGDLAVVGLTPQIEGYCANLTRTFVIGEPSPDQERLLKTYAEMIETTRQAMTPGTKVRELDEKGKNVCEAHGLGQYHVAGISHGIGLRFEETPASTIIPQHRSFTIREGMTLTIGHTVLAIPGMGGVRHEDVYLVTPKGGEILYGYPVDPVIGR